MAAVTSCPQPKVGITRQATSRQLRNVSRSDLCVACIKLLQRFGSCCAGSIIDVQFTTVAVLLRAGSLRIERAAFSMCSDPLGDADRKLARKWNEPPKGVREGVHRGLENAVSTGVHRRERIGPNVIGHPQRDGYGRGTLFEQRRNQARLTPVCVSVNGAGDDKVEAP